MNQMKNMLPDKLFGIDVSVLTIWLVPTGVMVGLVFVFWALVVPRIEDISKHWSQRNKVGLETTLLNAKRTYLLSLDQEELKANSVIVESGVLSEKNSYLLVKVISRVVAQFGYSVGDFSVSLGNIKEISKTSNAFDYQKVPVEVVVIGPRQNFLAMVSGIENSLPVLSIDNFSMSGIDDIATIKMSISAYYLPEWNQKKLENLSVSDLTPNKDEQVVLSKISNFKFYGETDGGNLENKQRFIPTNRVDPFY